jgi:hypothetical protein
MVTMIGVAGGTVEGPDGARVVIPPGALTADTPIGIEQTSAGAPALPDGFLTLSPMFAFTPHGIIFAVRVTVTLPFDPALVPAGESPALYRTDPIHVDPRYDRRWNRIANATFTADSASAEVTNFSWVQLARSEPERLWSLFLTSSSGEHVIAQGVGVEAGEIRENSDLGSSDVDIGSDGTRSVAVFSNADGTDFWVSAEAPLDGAANPTDDWGSSAYLRQGKATSS